MKNIIIIIALLIGAYFLVTKVVDTTEKLEDNNDMHTNYYKKKVEDKDKRYHKEDSIGQTVFNGVGLSLEEKKDIWSRSPLKDEMISKFPKFDMMYMFTRNRIEDSDLRRVVDRVIKGVETKFLSGSVDANEAKYQLGLME
ncbi:MAG: hypothetical protein KU28_10645 [Sulfurovum sp. PC08-66]|nr:MAG: hypothetical protein KU28_10645 [Sulfurovum sp. PC08-66]